MMIQVREGIPSKHQRLIYAGRQLNDNSTLQHCNIQDAARVHYVFSEECKYGYSGISESDGYLALRRGEFISPIVSIDYEVVNGMPGMMKYLIIRLCDLMETKPECVRAVIGMCKEFFKWTKSVVFTNRRKTYLSPVLRELSISNLKITRNVRCTFVSEDQKKRTVYLKALTTEDIFRWSVQIVYSSSGCSFFGIGGVPADNYPGDSLFLSYCFVIRRNCDGTYSFDLRGAKDANDARTVCSPVPSNSVLSLELDNNLRTLSLFVGDRKIPHVFTNMPSPFYFGVSGHPYGAAVTSLSARRLRSATLSTVQCSYYEFNERPL